MAVAKKKLVKKPEKKSPKDKMAKSILQAFKAAEDDSAEVRIINPLESVVNQLRADLERVNKTLIQRNDELDAARKVADREVFKDVVVLSAMLDAKAYITSRGGIEGALIIQRIANVEMRLGEQALKAAVVLQKIKSLASAKLAGHEVFPEELEELFKNGEKLL